MSSRRRNLRTLADVVEGGSVEVAKKEGGKRWDGRGGEGREGTVEGMVEVVMERGR